MRFLAAVKNNQFQIYFNLRVHLKEKGLKVLVKLYLKYLINYIINQNKIKI